MPGGSPQDQVSEGGGIEPLLADHDQTAAALLILLPGAIKTVLDAGSDTLDQKPHRLIQNLGESLDAKDVVLRRRLGNFLNQDLRGLETLEIDDKGLKIVGVVLGLIVVTGDAVADVLFGSQPEPQQDGGRYAAVLRFDALDRAGNPPSGLP